MVSLYDIFMHGFENRFLRYARREILSYAHGDVLEIGGGTGLNLEHYMLYKINSLTLTDLKVSKKLKSRVNNHVDKQKIILMSNAVEKLPFDDESFDTVVFTLVFCSVQDVNLGLQEIKRVMKKDAKLLFIEHIHPQKNPLKSLFSWINPLWKSIASGCNLTRDIKASLIANGFTISKYQKLTKSIFVGGCAKK